MIWPAVHRRHAIPAVILAALGACGGREPGHPLAVRRDSAGIQIVENRDPAWPSGQGWRIADTPFVQVGAQEGDPQYQFSEVRGVLRLDDGRLVVGDGESRQLRFYSADGVFDLASGRQGGGPGEFGRLGWVGRYRGD